MVLLLYVVYIVAACWGVTNIREGLEKRNTANYDSYSVLYYDLEDDYFKEYAFTISVMFSGKDLDFSSKETQDRIDGVLRELENSTYVDARVTQCWLRDFLDYIERTKEVASEPDEEGNTTVLDVSTEEAFARTLRDVYLADPWAENNQDVAFSEDGKRVVAARFLIQVRNKRGFRRHRLVASFASVGQLDDRWLDLLKLKRLL